MYKCWYCEYYNNAMKKEPCSSCGEDKKNFVLWISKKKVETVSSSAN